MKPFFVFAVIGTRPEAIKMAPLVAALRTSSLLRTKICVTSQHREMLQSVLDIFNIIPDFDLDIMRPKQELAELSARILEGVGKVLADEKPDLVLVHGDTTTAFMVALSAFYLNIPVGHVEAGLRTYNRRAPFPEEINRICIDSIAQLLFAPTETAAKALSTLRIAPSAIHLTGNTIVDALIAIRARAKNRSVSPIPAQAKSKKIILVTGHRRENFGEGFESICTALKEIAVAHPEVHIIYPVHLNPSVQEPVRRIVGNISNITLTEPLDYASFVECMSSCSFLLSDSGGIQEEACVLKKPVLLMREITERPEAVEAGFVKLVGTDRVTIIAEAEKLLNDQVYYDAMTAGVNPYGDGTASLKILRVIETFAQTRSFCQIK